MEYLNWEEITGNLTDGELAEIMRNRANEPTEKVDAVLNEIKRRGLEADDYPESQELVEIESSYEETEPVLYSQQVVYLFSVFFSVFFGGILLARNMKEVGSRNGMTHVIVFSLVYSFFSMYILEVLKIGLPGTVVMASVGALILNTAFWNKYIGKETVFIRKSYRKPLIIGLAVFIPLTFLSLYLTLAMKQ